MQVIRSATQLRKFLKRRRGTIGFVPTMGALHEGHLSLVRACKKENDCSVVSLFVNPLQFGPGEDFKRYPRLFPKDRKKLAKEKADVLFYPPVREIYPQGFATQVVVGKSGRDPLAHSLCGKFRPGHFDGVATVVAKLFQTVQPRRAYFGLKDYQQCAVIKRMAQDLGFPVQIRTLSIVREKDGLAMSSRNAYLSAGERKRAVSLPQTLFWLKRELKKGRTGLDGLKSQARSRLRKAALRIQYLEIVDPGTLQVLRQRQRRMVVLAACYVGKTRLIDNVIIQ